MAAIDLLITTPAKGGTGNGESKRVLTPGSNLNIVEISGWFYQFWSRLREWSGAMSKLTIPISSPSVEWSIYNVQMFRKAPYICKINKMVVKKYRRGTNFYCAPSQKHNILWYHNFKNLKLKIQCPWRHNILKICILSSKCSTKLIMVSI